MEKIRISQVIVVEGRCDAAHIRNLVDGTVVETGGFRIFSQKQKLALLRRLAAERGLLILTDGDGAGFVIRGFLKGAIPKEQVRHVYVPDIYGKERRKRRPSAEGKLGVEGIPLPVLRECLLRAGVEAESVEAAPRAQITKADLYADGLSGRPNSAAARERFLRLAGLPARMSSGAMLAAVNVLMTPEEYRSLAAKAMEREI